MELIGAAIFAVVIGLILARLWKSEPEEEPEEEPDDFDLMTVSEKFEAAKQTSDDLHGMEQLVTELDTCSAERQTVVQISWTGEDGETHEHDLFCDGMNTATECLREIAERETHDLRRVLAYQCETLAAETRSRRNGRRNGRKAAGEGRA